MKFNQDREWIEKMAKLEDNADVTVGVPSLQYGEQVAYARVLDAISWLMKAEAQLRICNHYTAQIVADLTHANIDALWTSADMIAKLGSNDLKADPHKIMIQHALMNAAGHAHYAGDIETATDMAGKAMKYHYNNS